MATSEPADSGLGSHDPMFNPVELAVVSPLIRGINFNYDILTECKTRGFIPVKLGEALVIAKFLSRTILAAHLAQRTYGILASFLLGVAMQESAFEASRLAGEDGNREYWPGCDCCYSPGITRSGLWTWLSYWLNLRITQAQWKCRAI